MVGFKQLKKNDVYVEVKTKKQARKLKKTLDMFGEKIHPTTAKGLSVGIDNDGDSIFDFPYIKICKKNVWIGWSSPFGSIAKVSVKQLRNILAIEHLKEGDVIIAGISNGIDPDINFKYIVKVSGLDVDSKNMILSHRWFDLPDGVVTNSEKGGSFESFIRYATDDEKALLCPKVVYKFADLKKAHANGEEIQYLSKLSNGWITDKNPSWNESYEYRIKPEEKPNVGHVVKAWNDGNGYVVGVVDRVEYQSNNKFGLVLRGSITELYMNFEIVTPHQVIELLFGKEVNNG